MQTTSLIIAAILGVVAGVTTSAQVTDAAHPHDRDGAAMTHKEVFRKLVGKWTGTCRTWFEPGKLADEAQVSGEYESVFAGRFVRHVYHGSIQAKPRLGEELIAFNPITQQYEISWIDDFHMNYAILYSVGPATDSGFSVRADYDVGRDMPRWGWRTEYRFVDDDHLTITAYNITPAGEEAKGVETVYERVK